MHVWAIKRCNKANCSYIALALLPRSVPPWGRGGGTWNDALGGTVVALPELGRKGLRGGSGRIKAQALGGRPVVLGTMTS